MKIIANYNSQNKLINELSNKYDIETLVKSKFFINNPQLVILFTNFNKRWIKKMLIHRINKKLPTFLVKINNNLQEIENAINNKLLFYCPIELDKLIFSYNQKSINSLIKIKNYHIRENIYFFSSNPELIKEIKEKCINEYNFIKDDLLINSNIKVNQLKKIKCGIFLTDKNNSPHNLMNDFSTYRIPIFNNHCSYGIKYENVDDLISKLKNIDEYFIHDKDIEWIDKNNNKNIEMTVALPCLNVQKILWLALESLKNQININFAWELIVFEEFGISKELIKTYFGKLPGCKRIFYRSISKNDGVYSVENIKSTKCTSNFTLLEKWISMAKISSNTSQIFVKHAADCYSPPKRLYIHYKHFQNKNCFYSTQPKGYYYNIFTEKFMLYDGNIIDKKENRMRKCHLNMALLTNLMKKIKLANNPRRSGIDNYLLKSIFSITKINPARNKIIFSDQEVDKENWKYSLDTHGFNQITFIRTNIFNNKITKYKAFKPIDDKKEVLAIIPEYIMDKLRESKLI